ncbi:MAG: hypothetical protein K8E24_000065 [Methanobacterium paludis]|nr:hypothetical protein [Methanobacterium paludis]
MKTKMLECMELNGKHLFNPRYVGECLEMPRSTVFNHINQMNDNQKVKLNNSEVQDLGLRKLNNTGETFLTDSALYQLIFRSRAPKADGFSDWVTGEVLPRLRNWML